MKLEASFISTTVKQVVQQMKMTEDTMSEGEGWTQTSSVKEGLER